MPQQLSDFQQPLSINFTGRSKGRGIPEQLLDILLSRCPRKICSPADPTSLQEARGIRSLQGHRQSAMPSREKSRRPPVAQVRKLRHPLASSVRGVPQEVQSLGSPSAESFDRERHQPRPGKSFRRVASMFPLGGALSRRSVPGGRCGLPRATFRMAYHNVTVDQGVCRRPGEAVIEPGLLNLPLAGGVLARPSPSRLVDLRGGGVPRIPADGGEDVAQQVVPAEDQAPQQAS